MSDTHKLQNTSNESEMNQKKVVDFIELSENISIDEEEKYDYSKPRFTQTLFGFVESDLTMDNKN